jgi:hypothetical protein
MEEILSASEIATIVRCGNVALGTAALPRLSSRGNARPNEKTLSGVWFQIGLLDWIDCHGRLFSGLAVPQPDVTSHTCSRQKQRPERDEKDKH